MVDSERLQPGGADETDVAACDSRVDGVEKVWLHGTRTNMSAAASVWKGVKPETDEATEQNLEKYFAAGNMTDFY